MLECVTGCDTAKAVRRNPPHAGVAPLNLQRSMLQCQTPSRLCLTPQLSVSGALPVTALPCQGKEAQVPTFGFHGYLDTSLLSSAPRLTPLSVLHTLCPGSPCSIGGCQASASGHMVAVPSPWEPGWRLWSPVHTGPLFSCLSTLPCSGWSLAWS